MVTRNIKANASTQVNGTNIGLEIAEKSIPSGITTDDMKVKKIQGLYYYGDNESQLLFTIARTSDHRIRRTGYGYVVNENGNWVTQTIDGTVYYKVMIKNGLSQDFTEKWMVSNMEEGPSFTTGDSIYSITQPEEEGQDPTVTEWTREFGNYFISYGTYVGTREDYGFIESDVHQTIKVAFNTTYDEQTQETVPLFLLITEDNYIWVENADNPMTYDLVGIFDSIVEESCGEGYWEENSEGDGKVVFTWTDLNSYKAFCYSDSGLSGIQVGDNFYIQYYLDDKVTPGEEQAIAKVTGFITTDVRPESVTVEYSVTGDTWQQHETILTDPVNFIFNIPKYLYLRFSEDVIITEE